MNFDSSKEISLKTYDLKVHFLRAQTSALRSWQKYVHGGVLVKAVGFGDPDAPFLELTKHLLFEKKGLKSLFWVWKLQFPIFRSYASYILNIQ